MTNWASRLNFLAWLAAAVAILIWALAPTLVQAGTVVVPKAPKVEQTVLAPPVLVPKGTMGQTE